MEVVDAVVIGAGVIGLAVGRALAMRGLETLVLERENAIGTATSSRNSEVIHAGIYYPSGSLKATLCVRGRKQLYAYCEQRGIAHRRCGKLLVATSQEQCNRLAQIQSQAQRNGVADLCLFDATQVRAMEPDLDVVAALHSPSTGIVDSHGLMLALHGELESNGGALALLSPVISIQADATRHVLHVGGRIPMELGARVVVNAAGLWAPGLAATIAALAPSQVPLARYAKGNYFSLAARTPFSHLIYPVPEEAGLGVHLTLDLAGRARFGPDVQWIEPDSADEIDYRVDPSRSLAFEAQIRRYWPGLPLNSLQADYSGVRPKLQSQGSPSHDFELQGPAEHGVAGLMNLYGIESPGLTASLALADEVLRRLRL
jgi:L-2-hydroxyglutarate oxidase LhgO